MANRKNDAVEEIATQKELGLLPPRIDDDTLAAIGSIEDGMIATMDVFGEPSTSIDEVLGTGFEILNKEDKDRLLGVHFFVMTFNTDIDGDTGKYASMSVVTNGGEKFVVNDGSTGIREQLIKYRDKTGRSGNFHVRHGLRVSRYRWCDVGHEQAVFNERTDKCPQCANTDWQKGATYYLNTSK